MNDKQPYNSLSAPSGIAQLRKASDHRITQVATENTTSNTTEPMNLDDFLVPTSMASPAGLSPSPSGEKMANSKKTVASAIAIRKANNIEQDLLLSRTAPIVAPTRRRDPEFGYVQRHVRKTSIDERRVSGVLAY
jgi:GATA-binding protein